MGNDVTNTITSDDDWLDLRQDEQGLVRGKLYTALAAGSDGIVVSTVAWEVIAITLSERYGGKPLAAGTDVTIVARRTEDGLQADVEDISVKEEK